ncbi:hypothetical protein [Taibaiella chishuiensis]|uniref:Uncharacterized protein n=1 Tax=Taibaiella chishuiensis TaxID=1434707 RepID=A0A2P8DAE0_9BACT|nr:hypothetical protein [Taibaiella chishuiensis]PSK94175.1 hypothetical protein B0I18_101328 [Taibaiella chishuiensis]
MKKTILILLVMLTSFGKGLFAQMMVTFENTTPQYFVATLLDKSWTPAPVNNYFIDVVNNLTQDRYPVVQTGNYLATVADWRGVALRTYPQGQVIAPIYSATGTFPLNGSFFVTNPGNPPIRYYVTCSIISPTQIRVRIYP